MFSPLEEQFHDQMITLYERAKSECRYNATRFLQMVAEFGGVQAAKRLIAAPGVSDGITRLSECRRLDLSMEALMIRAPWRQLFTQDELEVAEKRLRDRDYPGLQNPGK